MQRLQDRISQTEYLIKMTSELERCGKSALFSINGMDKVLIVINIPTPKLYTLYLSSSTNTTGPTVPPLTVDIHSNGSYDGIDADKIPSSKVPSSLAAEIQQAAHHQFTRDEAMDQINR